MIGFGAILAGILGVLLIDGHHLGMIDGGIMYIMVGIITDGDTTDTTVMVGIIIMDGTTTMDRVGEEVMLPITTEEGHLHQE